MKKIISLLSVFAMALGLAACSSSTPAPHVTPTEIPAKTPAETLIETPGETLAENPAESAAAVNTVILKEEDEQMMNRYSVIAVDPAAPFVDADGNPVADVAVNTAGADALIHWLLSQEALDMAGEYGVAECGEHLFYVIDDVPVYTGEIAPATEETRVIRMATTTSVNDSGLLGYMLPKFEETYGYTVEIQSAGTGKAIAAATYGNADLILVHSKSQEETFVADGFARVVEGFETERLTFIYNYFVLCGLLRILPKLRRQLRF